ncbi:helix-turn-helix transcriptional regulator [Nocardia terpenica]|uniref:helix-turn-helix domain-containing protein n=1 Tax=Nocardia terpenica TaxID=455432 RepID=UPI001893F965|nr:helix-turn-helix transcriptional regulator [Nocardia terpenica]MBF6065030.1 helix-turn-helix transcriptional regulator [Nocardia terpenica]MBF6108087.1 helix-turn-helix transcriptional regulator [Nocardia terpenica]MBF6115302.1 helix-turn-helix transcriptional regulator [Nocardia terpenica]MBF6122624.1 helix-turn-helix transcriptional regulator [Nocardia terpenica]
MVDPDRAIGKRIEALRTGIGLSQEHMSAQLRRAGVNWSQVTLSKVEAGQRPAKFSEILAIADLFDIETVELSPDGGGFGYQYHKARHDRDNAAKQVRKAEQVLERARARHRQLTQRAARLRLAVELASGQRGPYRVNEPAADYLHDLHSYLWEPAFLTQPTPADEADALGVLQRLGVNETVIAEARAQVRADFDATVADINNDIDRPFPDYTHGLGAWEPPSGDIPHPASPSFGGDMQDLEDHFITGMAVRLMAEHFPFVRFTTPDWDTTEVSLDRQPIVQGLITDD